MSPRTKEQFEAIRSQSIRRILDAAFCLISKNGYESTSISQIAKEAGISKGLVYNYFDSKEDILVSLVESAFSEGEALFEEKFETTEPEEALCLLFDWFFNELRTQAELWKLITEMAFKIEKFPFIGELLQNKLREYFFMISQLLAQVGMPDPENEARMLAAVFDGIGFHYLIAGDEYPLDKMEQFLINKYCKNHKEQGE